MRIGLFSWGMRFPIPLGCWSAPLSRSACFTLAGKRSIRPSLSSQSTYEAMPFEPNHPGPKVSVAILTRNGGALFHRVIEALISQQTEYPFEIVILDSASKDETAGF